MAIERRIYPMIPTRTWWDLRKAFIRSMPGEVSPRYLATVLGIQERAAANVMPNLRRVGLIDEGGAPTERAVVWRDDSNYGTVCRDIIAEVYPQQLTDAAPPPSPDRDRVTSWFARETRTGSAASTQMARLYLLLATADATASDAGDDGSAPPRPVRAGATRSTASGTPRTRRSPEVVSHAPVTRSSHREEPSVHIDIQVHIDATASAEQIDQIFKSMSQHLYGRER
jgi:hypothetical protein